MLLPLQFSGLQIVCSLTWHSLLQLLGPAASSRRMRDGGQALWLCGFVFLPGNGGCQTTAVAPLPGSLGSAVYTDYSGKNTLSTFLLLRAAETACCKLIPLLSWETHSELWAVFATPISALLPSFLPCLPEFTHLQMFQCVNLSDMFVCWEENLWLNYSCPMCNFKGWYQGHPLCCHASDVTLIIFKQRNIILISPLIPL